METYLGPILDAIPAMAWTAQPDGRVDFVNRRWSEYIGRRHDEAHGGEWQAAINPDDLPPLLDRWRSILASGEPGEMAARIRRFDGQYRWVAIQWSPMRDDAGRVAKWCGIGTDVEDVRSAEEVHRQRELDFQLIVDSIPIPVAVTTPSGEVEGVNQLTLDYFGKTFEELKGWKASDVVHPDDLERTIAAQLHAHQKGSTYNVESRHRRADGVYRWFNVLGLPLRDLRGRILRWLHLLVDIDDRKQAEEALRDSEQSSRLIVDGIPGLVAAFAPRGDVEFVNRQVLEYFGKTLEELKRWETSDATHPDDLPRAVELFTQSIASGEPFEFEVRARRFDGVYRWFQSRGFPLRDTNGRIVRWYNLLIDVDERKRAEEARRISESNLKLLIDTIPDLVWATGPDGSVEFVNRHFLDYVGLSFEEIRDSGWTIAFHPDDLSRLASEWGAIVAAGKAATSEGRLRRFDGEYRWFLLRANPLYDEKGNIVRWYGINTDISDRKRAEEALAARERNLYEIINTIPVLAWAARPDGTPEYFNQHYLDYVGLAAGQSEYWDLTAGIHPDDVDGWLATWQAILASGQPGEAEARLRQFDQKYRWFLFRANPLRDESGNIIKWYGVSIDIDERKRAEEALHASEREARLIVDSIPAGVAVLAPTGEVEVSNKHILEYFGRTGDEMKQWGTAGVVHPEDLPRVIETRAQSIAAGHPHNTEQRLRGADGTYRWFEVRKFPLRDSNGRVIRWYALHVDIDDQKGAEEALRESEREARLIVDSIPGGVEVLSPTGQVEAVNEHVARYFGKRADELKRTGLTGFIHPEDVQNVLDTALRSTTTGDPYDAEMRFLGANGKYRWFHVRGLPLRDVNGRIVRWYALHIDIDDRKRVEEALRESERNFKLTIDTIPALAWSARPDGSAEFFSQHYLDYVGLSAEQAQGWGWAAAVHPDDLSGLTATWQAIMASGKAGEAEARLRRFDGDYRWLLFRTNPLRDASGNIVKWYGVNTDIDDRKRAETNLAREKQLLEMIASGRPLRDVLSALCEMVEEAGPGCYCDVHPIDWSGPSIEYSVAPSLPASYTDPIAGLSLNGDALPCAIAVRQKVQVIAEDMDTDPRWHESSVRTHVLEHGLRSVWSTPIYAKDGRVLGTLCLYQRQPASPTPQQQGLIAHATQLASIAIERWRTEAALRRSETLLAEGQQLSSTGSFSWRVDTDEIAFSEELCRIFEFDPNSVVTLEQFRARVHPEDMPSLSAQIDRVRAGYGYPGYEIRLRMPDDRVKYLRTFGRVVRHQDGRLECLAAVQDVTERRLADEALNKARSEFAHVARVTSLGALTASIAHEVNQPLSGIITNAGTCLRMLAADPPNLDGARETARRTIRDGNRAADVITRLRTLFSKRTAAIEPVDLNEAAGEVIDLLSSDLQRSRVVLRTAFADGLPLVGGDRIQLQQVLMNLLRNAADAMSSVDDRPRLLVVRTRPCEGDQVSLSVQDAGIGFGPEAAERLFEAFYTTKTDGMGIGLSVSRSIIESHKGRLWAASNDGPGATFSFSIPRYSGGEAPSQDISVAGTRVISSAQSVAETS